MVKFHHTTTATSEFGLKLQLAGLPPRPEDHKDGVSFVAALKGAPFDRGPTICDEPNFTPATHGIPNTSTRILTKDGSEFIPNSEVAGGLIGF